MLTLATITAAPLLRCTTEPKVDTTTPVVDAIDAALEDYTLRFNMTVFSLEEGEYTI